MSHAAEFDAHGHKDHGHVIVSVVTLRLVLGALLFFTLLTVGMAELERWIAHAFHVHIPTWFNVSVALGIATIKTTLVVLYFMQLKYDNPLNLMVFLFTLMAAVCFLGFTAMDLAGRGTIEPLKAAYVIPGGTGQVPKSIGKDQSGIPITEAARQAAIAAGTYDPHKAHGAHGGLQSVTDAGFVPKPPAVGSSSNLSRPVTGVTIQGLPGYKAPGAAHEPAHAPQGDATPSDAHAKPAQADEKREGDHP